MTDLPKFKATIGDRHGNGSLMYEGQEIWAGLPNGAKFLLGILRFYEGYPYLDKTQTA